ncbi:MAG TPA: DUF4097 family beta strand repeat-containing protein [Streptosporangiaceae bacterium]|nr:DUF4097 family beta strand repeat-containing protein [Streptosporangiaceae bacterium]
MANWEYPATGPIDLDISLTAGSIAVTAEDTEVITVRLLPNRPGRSGEEAADDVTVDFSGDRLVIAEPKYGGLRRHGPSFSLDVKVPPGSRCTVRTAACDVACDGELGALDIRTASGDVGAAVVTGPVQVHTASGDVKLDDAAAELTVHTGTGDVRIGHVGGELAVDTASGDISIGNAAASASARTASGNVRIASLAAGHADLTSVSGDVAVGVAPGTGVYLDLGSVSGQVSSDLDASQTEGRADLELRCRTVSGSLWVGRAALAGDRS